MARNAVFITQSFAENLNQQAIVPKERIVHIFTVFIEGDRIPLILRQMQRGMQEIHLVEALPQGTPLVVVKEDLPSEVDDYPHELGNLQLLLPDAAVHPIPGDPALPVRPVLQPDNVVNFVATIDDLALIRDLERRRSMDIGFSPIVNAIDVSDCALHALPVQAFPF